MAHTDEVRNQIMPINRKYNLAALLEACQYHISRKNSTSLSNTF